MFSFSMNRIRIGSAVTAQAMPTPVTNCQVMPLEPIQPSYFNMHAAAMLPNSSGVPKASAAVMPLSSAMPPGLAQVEFDTGNPDEEHHRPPGDAVQQLDHLRLKHEGVIVGEGGT